MTVVARNIAVPVATTLAAIWITTLESNYWVFAVPFLIAAGAQLVNGTTIVKLVHLAISIIIIGMYWLPKSASSPDGEALDIMIFYLVIWFFSALAIFGILSVAKRLARRNRAA